MKILIVFETQNGTTQYVAEVMQQTFQEKGHEATLHSVRNQGMTPNFADYEVVLFGAPTYEDGKLENTMRVFTAKSSPDLSTKKVAVFGLGSSIYPQFCFSAQILADWVTKNKGSLVVEPLKIDGFPDDMTSIQNWVGEIVAKLS